MLNQYYSIDVLSSLVSAPEDCFLDWATKIGRHCFSDYGSMLGIGMRPNPLAALHNSSYRGTTTRRSRVAARQRDVATHVARVVRAYWQMLQVPQLGLLAYLLALTIACLTPAVCAARGARGLERVVFVTLGAAAIPAWMAIDRGNSAGFGVPIALVFLVALCRRRWGWW